MTAVEIMERLISDIAGAHTERVLAFDKDGDGPFRSILETTVLVAVARAEAELQKARLITGEVPR